MAEDVADSGDSGSGSDTEVLEGIFGSDFSGEDSNEGETVADEPARPKKSGGGKAKASTAPNGKPKAATPSDPFAVLGNPALTEEGRALAGAVRHLQSVSDSRAARLEGQLQQIGQALMALRQPQAAPTANEGEPAHPLANVQLTTDQREALGLVETLFEHRLRTSGLSKVQETLTELRGAIEEIRGTLGNQTRNSVQGEAQEILEVYPLAEIQTKLPVLKAMRGLPHPDTGRPMSLKAAMDLLSGNGRGVPAQAQPESTDFDPDDLVLSAKRRAGRPPGAGGRPGGKLSPQELDTELTSLFGGA